MAAEDAIDPVDDKNKFIDELGPELSHCMGIPVNLRETLVLDQVNGDIWVSPRSLLA